MLTRAAWLANRQMLPQPNPFAKTKKGSCRLSTDVIFLPRDIIQAQMKNQGETYKEGNLQLDAISPALLKAVPNSILTDPQISVPSKVVYATFFKYIWHNDSCFPSQARLAEDIGCTSARVSQWIAELVKAGLITVERRGKGMTNIYTVRRRKPDAVHAMA